MARQARAWGSFAVGVAGRVAQCVGVRLPKAVHRIEEESAGTSVFQDRLTIMLPRSRRRRDESPPQSSHQSRRAALPPSGTPRKEILDLVPPLVHFPVMVPGHHAASLRGKHRHRAAPLHRFERPVSVKRLSRSGPERKTLAKVRHASTVLSAFILPPVRRTCAACSACVAAQMASMRMNRNPIVNVPWSARQLRGFRRGRRHHERMFAHSVRKLLGNTTQDTDLRTGKRHATLPWPELNRFHARFIVAMTTIPSGTRQRRGRIADPRGWPKPRATGPGACRPQRTPWAA